MDDFKKYRCDICKLSTIDKVCFKSHLVTEKHLRNMLPTSDNEKEDTSVRHVIKIIKILLDYQNTLMYVN